MNTYFGRTLGTPNISIERRTYTYSGKMLGTPNIRIERRTNTYSGKMYRNSKHKNKKKNIYLLR